MSRPLPDAVTVLAGEVTRRSGTERDIFLREMLAYAAAGLMDIHGPQLAAEACYSLGDTIATGTPAR